MATASTSNKQVVGEALRVAGFHRLFAELQEWRVSAGVKELEVQKGSALILPFVKGLRLSAQLIYILREELSETGLEVNWGHLLDANDRFCSPECDIIIHRTGYVRRWNGDDKPVMDFRFVRQDRAVAIISCKSFATGVDAEYVQKLRPYVKNVFLFAECCAVGKGTSLRKRAKAAGYVDFGYLYAFDEKRSECVHDDRAWLDFLNAVGSKVKKARRANG